MFSDSDPVSPNLFAFPKDGKSIYQDFYYFLSTKVLPKFISDLTGEERLPNGRIKKIQAKAEFQATSRNYHIIDKRLAKSSMSYFILFSKKNNTKYTITYDHEISSQIQYYHRAKSNYYPKKITKEKFHDAEFSLDRNGCNN